MNPRKYRWSKVYESSEEELQEFLTRHKTQAERVVVAPTDDIESRVYTKDVTIFCAEGSLSFYINGTTMSLQPGDALMIPANTSFETTAGISGYVSYETAS